MLEIDLLDSHIEAEEGLAAAAAAAAVVVAGAAVAAVVGVVADDVDY